MNKPLVMPDFTTWKRENLEQFAREAYAKLVHVDTSAMWTPEEAAKLLAERPHQAHYIEAVIRKCMANSKRAPILREPMDCRAISAKAQARRPAA